MIIMAFRNLDEYYIRLNLVFHAILAAPLLLFIYIYLETRNGDMEPPISDAKNLGFLQLSITFITAIFVFLAFSWYRTRLSQVKPKDHLIKKLEYYRKIGLVQYILFGVASFTTVLGLYLTGKGWYTGLYVIVLMLMSINRPTLKKISDDMRLKGEERQIVLHKKPLSDEGG